MKRFLRHKSDNIGRIIITAVALVIGVTFFPGLKTEARAGSGGAFVGGLIVGKVLNDAIRRDKIRTAAAVEAASQPRTVVVHQPAPRSSTPAPAPKTTEQKLAELDQLAAGGYITPTEYKERRKAILGSQ